MPIFTGETVVTVSKVWNVEVEMPLDIHEYMQQSAERRKRYELASAEASAHVAASGQNSYSAVIEWGEDPDRACVEAFAECWVRHARAWRKEMEANPDNANED